MRYILIFLGIFIFALLPTRAQFKSTSVLNKGKWIKLGIVETGVYRLDGDYLSSIGLDPSSLDPQKIQIYGNGGGMLPQANDAFRHDDLVQNRIEVRGEEDASFDPGDFVLFYAEGPHSFKWDVESQLFRHSLNLYSDTNYYFLHIGDEQGLRIIDEEPIGDPTYVPPYTRNRLFYEKELDNEIFTGRYWLGEDFNEFDPVQSFSFFMPDVKEGEDIDISIEVGAAAGTPTSFDILVGNQVASTITLPRITIGSETSDQYKLEARQISVSSDKVVNDSLEITLRYNYSQDNRGKGWLSYIEIDYAQAPSLARQSQSHISLADGIGENEIASISLRGSNSSTRIWNVDDPTRVKSIPYTTSSDGIDFAVKADQIRDIHASKGGYLQPASYREVANQNLHGQSPASYLMISAEEFLPEAQRLADFHETHYGRTVAIATPRQIYNEFSSGRQDVSAIRDYIKMHYDRGLEVNLEHVLLFGDGSFVYKYIDENTNNLTNFIPTYQSRNSWRPDFSFTSDDFFVMLEEDEGYWGEGTDYRGDNQLQRHDLDVAIGRLPIESPDQAKEIVDKIIRYVTNPNGADFGKWRNRIVFIADHKDQDGSIHARQANGYTSLIDEVDPCYNLEKIFMDNYNLVITAGEKEFPEGRKDLLEAFDAGSLILNYTGHGGYNSWSDARIFTNSDLPNIDNPGRFPVVMTATCTYGRFDDPFQRSGAEILMMMPNTGAIAMFTTVRLVYSGPNATLNRNFYKYVFDYNETKGRMPTMGEIFVATKNETYGLSNINTRAFTLLGDPGIIMNYPRLRTVVKEINDRPIDPSREDSLKSLGKVSIKGEMQDREGNPVSNFNGALDVTVFDKPSEFTTNRAPFTFTNQVNRIFNGSATVEGGKFDFEFVVPIDISYEDGRGKISLYARGEEIDGGGCLTDLVVGGTDANAAVDNEGPKVSLFINDSLWKDGGITSADPFLYALVEDENGINTVGTGIGHEISAFLDGNQEEVIILNDFYTAFPNSYQRGSVRFQLEDLENGPHNLKIRVWDVANNSSEAETNFIVADNVDMVLDQILSVPNPARVGEGSTFWVKHNLDGKEIRVDIDVINLTGTRIAALSSQFIAQGNNYQGLRWDAKTEQGTPVSEGMYFFYVRVTNVESGEQVQQTERMVLIK